MMQSQYETKTKKKKDELSDTEYCLKHITNNGSDQSMISQNRTEKSNVENRNNISNDNTTNEFQCEICKNKFVMNHGIYRHKSIKKYIHIWVCQQCQSVQQKQKNKHKTMTSFQCIEKCNDNGKIWNSINSDKVWQRHYKRKHPTEEFLAIIDSKLCENETCTEIIATTDTYCLNHVIINDRHSINENNNENNYNPYIFKDTANAMFDTKKTMRKIDIKMENLNEYEKHRAAEVLVKSIRKISQSNKNFKLGMEGVIEMKSYAPTFYYQQHRYNPRLKKIENQKRKNLYETKEWNELWKTIYDEQDKRDEKKMRNESKKQNENIINNNLIKNERNKINNELLSQKIEELKYDEYEGKNEIKARIKSCIKEIQNGRIKKSMDRLKDGKLVNLSIDDNWKQLQSKFPQGTKIKTNINVNRKGTFDLKIKEMKQILLNLNTQSKGGISGFDNKLIKWITENNEIYKFVEALKKLIQVIVNEGLPNEIPSLMMFSMGIPIEKKKNETKTDVRPIVVCDTLIRIIDKFVMKNISNKKECLMGDTQLIGRNEGCEIGSLMIDNALTFIAEKKNLCILSVDATNAYSSIDRQRQYDLICKEIPELAQYFEFLYGESIKVDFGINRTIDISQGDIQGINSSELFYAMSKNKIQNDSMTEMKMKQEDFEILMQCDYCDDGWIVIDHKFVNVYAIHLESQYNKWNIKINKKKSEIIFNNNDIQFQTQKNEELKGYQCTYDGNITFLGITMAMTNILMTIQLKHYKK